MPRVINFLFIFLLIFIETNDVGVARAFRNSFQVFPVPDSLWASISRQVSSFVQFHDFCCSSINVHTPHHRIDIERTRFLEEFTRSKINGSAYIMSTAFAINLLAKKKEILKLIGDVNDVIYEYPEAKSYIERALQRSNRMFKAISRICFVTILVGNLVNPIVYNSIDISMLFVTVLFCLLSSSSLRPLHFHLHDFQYWTNLRLTNHHSYVEYFKQNLKDLNGNDAVSRKKQLIKCVKMHLNIQRYVTSLKCSI